MLEENNFIFNYLFEKRKKKLQDWQKSFPLRQIQWEATRQCDLDCLHCGSSCDSKIYNNELSKEEVVKVFSSIANDFDLNEIDLVSITGGEPLIRSDLPEVINQITSLGFKNVTIQTNGNTLFNNDELINRLLKAGISGIGLNLDGLEEQHDWQRNKKGNFNKVCKLAENLIKNTNLYVMITTVVNKSNYLDLENLYKIIHDIRPKRWRLIEVQPLGRAHNNQNLLLSKEQYIELVNYVYEYNLKSYHLGDKNKFGIELGCSGWLGKKFEGIVRPYIWHCHAGISTLGIWSDGAVGGCTDIDHFYSEGNVRCDSVKTIWQNGFEIYRDWQARKNGECIDCDQWDLCHGGAFHLRTPRNELLFCSYNSII